MDAYCDNESNSGRPPTYSWRMVYRCHRLRRVSGILLILSLVIPGSDESDDPCGPVYWESPPFSPGYISCAFQVTLVFSKFWYVFNFKIIKRPLSFITLSTGPRCVVRHMIISCCSDKLIFENILRSLLFVKCTMSIHAGYFLAVVEWGNFFALLRPTW